MVDTLRVSASDLDALRYFLASEEADLEALIAQLRRQSAPTEAMLAGTALHTALEAAEPGEFDRLEADGYTFEIAAEGEIDLPKIRECKGERQYLIDNCRITLVGKVDAIHGKRVDDHKFTGRFDPDRFLSSLQWRVYLEVFGADEFRWNVFEGREVGPKSYVITAIHPLRMHRYPGMEADVRAALRGFLDFARQHLPEKVKPWEPDAADYLAVG